MDRHVVSDVHGEIVVARLEEIRNTSRTHLASSLVLTQVRWGHLGGDLGSRHCRVEYEHIGPKVYGSHVD
jgi:hypothetical protein